MICWTAMPRFTSPFLAEFVDQRPITKSALLVNEIQLTGITKHFSTDFLAGCKLRDPFLTKR